MREIRERDRGQSEWKRIHVGTMEREKEKPNIEEKDGEAGSREDKREMESL
jgi:hypothetical protein